MQNMQKFSTELLSNTCHLYKCTIEDYQNIKINIENILSISVLDDEVSLFLYHSDSLHNFMKKFCIYDDRYYSIFRIYEDIIGIDHVGIISHISTKFSEQKIPILYLNTFSNNLILVSEEYRQQAIDIMKEISY